MAAQLNQAPDGERLVVATSRHRRRGLLLIAAAVFQLWVWGTRIRNLLGDAQDFSTGFVAVHLVLYTVSIAVGIVLGTLGVRMFLEARRADAEARR